MLLAGLALSPQLLLPWFNISLGTKVLGWAGLGWLGWAGTKILTSS